MSTSAIRSPKVLFLMASGSGFQLHPVNVMERSFDGRRSGQIPRDRVIEGLLHGRPAGGIKGVTARHHNSTANEIEWDTEAPQGEIVRQHPGELPIKIVIFQRNKGGFRPVDEGGDDLVDSIGVCPAEF